LPLGRRKICPYSPPVKPPSSRGHQQHAADDPSPPVAQEPQRGEQPQGIAGAQETQRLGESVPPIRQAVKEPVGQGQGGEAQDLDYEPPKQC